ncbi:hypothetical protein LA080_002614 [Diaporthe eres]|nr:hypothetical protein LA080_002614 [Diaporthe eres]
MELKPVTILLTLATFTLASPVIQKLPEHDEHPLTARQIASCETQTAAAQVSCIEACSGSPGCIVGCTATAVDGYISCAA